MWSVHPVSPENRGGATSPRSSHALKTPQSYRKSQPIWPLISGRQRIKGGLPFLIFHTQSSKCIFYDYFSFLKTFHEIYWNLVLFDTCSKYCGIFFSFCNCHLNNQKFLRKEISIFYNFINMEQIYLFILNFDDCPFFF